ncbi:MAG: hypothetical protein RR744_07795 [Cellulosilyticaceae bacterium]
MKSLICNMSNFTLGSTVSVVENGHVIEKIKVSKVEGTYQIAFQLCMKNKIDRISIVGPSVAAGEKLVSNFKEIGALCYAEGIDKIEFNVI